MIEANNRINKKGQMTALIIIAVVLVAAVVVYLVINTKSPRINPNDEDPSSKIKSCVKDVVENNVNQMISQTGLMETGNYIYYNQMNISYLCYNINSYETCVNQHPTYFTEIKTQLIDYSKEKIEECFQNVKKDLESKNTQVSMKSTAFSVDIYPGNVKVNLRREIIVTKGEISQNFDNFDLVISSPLYDLANVARDITNNEAKYCYFEYVGYMMLYPQFDIRRLTLSDSTVIYSIEHKPSGKTMKMAVRTCAIPPALGY